MTQQKLFAVSVADAYLRDTNLDALVVKGKALLTSSMEQTMQESEIFAGRGSQLQYTFNYQKVLAFQISAADFSPVYVAIQSGSEIKNKLSNYFTDESVTFDNTGSATLSKTPIAGTKVYVENGKGSTTVTPTGTVLSVPSLADKTVNVAYQFETTVDEITISASDFPKAYELTLISDIFNADGTKAYEQQIEVPLFKLDGALTLSLQHDSVNEFTLNGKALADSKGNYAYIKYLPVEGANIGVTMIATTQAEVSLSAGDTHTIEVLGIRPAPYGNVLLDNSTLTFSTDDPAIADVAPTGEITAVASGQVNITIEDASGNTDIVEVTVA